MNLIKEIKEIIERIDQYIVDNKESPELVYQLKILNGKIQLLKKEIESGKIQDEFEKSFDKLKAIQYSIHHHLLFGPLSTIVGLVSLIEITIEKFSIDKKMEEARIKELNTISHLVVQEVRKLKEQVMYILEGGDHVDERQCELCKKGKLK